MFSKDWQKHLKGEELANFQRLLKHLKTPNAQLFHFKEAQRRLTELRKRLPANTKAPRDNGATIADPSTRQHPTATNDLMTAKTAPPHRNKKVDGLVRELNNNDQTAIIDRGVHELTCLSLPVAISACR